MHSIESLLFIITKFLTIYVSIHTALVDFHLYKFTFLFFLFIVCCIVYAIYWARYDNQYKNYLSVIEKSLYKSFISVIESTNEDSKVGPYFVKVIFILAFVLCALFHAGYIYTSEITFMELFHKVHSVSLFYIFWCFFNIFCENLKKAIREEENIAFGVLDYLKDEETHNIFWNKILIYIDYFNDLLISNPNSHYAFVWSNFFCLLYIVWFNIPVTYMIEYYLIIFISILFVNLIQAIVASRALSHKVSAHFINQLFYIMLGASFLLLLSSIWYDPFCVKNASLAGYFLLTNGYFYFKTWIIFFFLLSLILANAQAKKSIASFVELSILFSASIPVIFIIVGLVDIFAIILSFEVLSLIIIGLCGLSMDKASTEASIKYFCQNSLITGLTFFGVFFYLFIFKNTNLLLTQFLIELLYETKMLTYFFKVLLFSSIILWLLSFMFKFGIFPVNFYVADIYKGSSAAVILFISSVIKPAVLFVFAIKVIPLFDIEIIITSIISCFCIASIILGDWMSLNSNNLKRFFGHSSVSQYGFLILATFSQSNDVFFFAFMYSFLYNIALFIILTMLVEHRNHRLVDISNLYFNDLNLYFSYNMSLKLLITLCFLLISGVPPFILFIFKYLILTEIFGTGNYIFLLIIFIFNTGVSSAYYFKILNDIWFTNLENSDSKPFITNKALLFHDETLVDNSKTFIFWFLVIMLTCCIIVYFDTIHEFVVNWVFDELTLKSWLWFE